MNRPQEQWRVELEKVNKDGLIYLVESLFDQTYRNLSPDERLQVVKAARSYGSVEARLRRLDQRIADPEKFEEKYHRRELAKIKARQRKRSKR